MPASEVKGCELGRRKVLLEEWDYGKSPFEMILHRQMDFLLMDDS
jgi:hypothetical protein